MTQQQPALQAHSAPAHDSQHAAVRVSPTDNIQSLRLKKEDHSQAELYGGADRKGRTRVGSSSKALHPQSPQPSEPDFYRGKLQQHNKGTGIGMFDIGCMAHRYKTLEIDNMLPGSG